MEINYYLKKGKGNLYLPSFVVTLFCRRALMSPRFYVAALLCRTLFCRALFLRRAFVAIPSRSTSTSQFSSRTTSWRLSEAQPGRKRAPTPEELRRRLPHTFRRINYYCPPSAPLNHATSSKPERGVTSTRNIAPCAVQRPGKPPL
jgi:hypothetical protein